MGEYADMILDGDMCEWCGEYLGDGDGYTQRCSACKREEKKSKKEKNHGSSKGKNAGGREQANKTNGDGSPRV